MPSTTINYTAAEGARIAYAVGRQKNLKNPDETPRDATAQECKNFVIERLREFVRSVEQQEAAQTATAAVQPIEPT